MYELIILSLLIRFPAHGYLIAHIINDMIGPYARMSNGRLYPLLAKLEQDGLIETDDEGEHVQRSERNSRWYHITESGRKRFHALMMDTTSNPGEYQRIFVLKVAVLYFLTPTERLYLIDHYSNYCQAHVLHLTAEGEDLATGNYHHYPGDDQVLPAILDVMKHMADQWRQEVEWALRLRTAEVARQEEIDSPGASKSGGDRASRVAEQQHQNQNQNQNHNRNQN
jgi:DNA-binding PadR family transcriptional regulator